MSDFIGFCTVSLHWLRAQVSHVVTYIFKCHSCVPHSLFYLQSADYWWMHSAQAQKLSSKLKSSWKKNWRIWETRNNDDNLAQRPASDSWRKKNFSTQFQVHYQLGWTALHSLVCTNNHSEFSPGWGKKFRKLTASQATANQLRLNWTTSHEKKCN